MKEQRWVSDTQRQTIFTSAASERDALDIVCVKDKVCVGVQWGGFKDGALSNCGFFNSNFVCVFPHLYQSS